MFLRILIMFILVFFCKVGFTVDKSDIDLKKAHNLMFNTKRTSKELEQAISIFESLYKEAEAKKEDDSSYKIDCNLLLEYVYALYYKAAYTYPREDEPHGKEFIETRLKLYEKADELSDELQKCEFPTNERKAESLFIAGIVKAEIASLKSSAFMIMKSRSLLEQALKTDSRIRNGALYVTLGRLYAKTPRILFGNKALAIKYLKRAQDEFDVPSIVAFYFEGDAILDGEDFKDLSKDDQKAVLNSFYKALTYEAQRESFPPSHPKSLTPEEKDSLKELKKQLTSWGIPATQTALKQYIDKL